MSRAELWCRNLSWPNWRHVAPSPSNIIGFARLNCCNYGAGAFLYGEEREIHCDIAKFQKWASCKNPRRYQWQLRTRRTHQVSRSSQRAPSRSGAQEIAGPQIVENLTRVSAAMRRPSPAPHSIRQSTESRRRSASTRLFSFICYARLGRLMTSLRFP
jgi:hypothetical protein